MSNLGPFDVLIAGAGLAGGSLAVRLARAGVNVAILDHSTFPRAKICGEFLSPESWRVFDDLDLTTAIERIGYEPIQKVRISTPRGREVTAEVIDSAGRPGIGLSRWALDDLLLRTAQAAGATVFEAARATGPLIEDGRIIGVAARPVSNEPLSIRARLTIAADGRQSALVKQTGTTRGRSWLRPRSFGMKRHWHLPDRADGEQPGTVGLHLIPGGYGGTCRIEGGQTNLCALLPEAAVKRHRGDLDRVARDQLARNPALARLLAGGEAMGDWKTVAGVRVQSSTPNRPGILYAGDAQGTVDPLGGQGMTMALLGAAELVPFVKAGLTGGVDKDLQERWRRTWQRRFGRRIGLCRAFHHFLIHPGLTDAASVMGPAARRFLAACYGLTRDPVRSGVEIEPVA